jgi:hypothetical protein
MRHFLLIALAALSAASFALTGRITAAGSYRLVPDDATRAFCRRHRLELPEGKLVLREDRTFSLTVKDDEGTHRTEGRYRVREDEVEFLVDEGDGLDLPREMRLDEDGLSDRDRLFERVQEPRKPVRVARPPARIPVPPVIEPPLRPAYRVTSLSGTWTLRRNGSEDRSTRFTFDRDGTFRFVGMNAHSKGRYVLDGDGVELIWTEIDGERVDSGHVVRKRIPFDEMGFYVDDYRYERQR